MPIETKRYKIRLLHKEEIPRLLELCKAEGRHMGQIEEVESWLQVDPYGFFIAVADDGMFHFIGFMGFNNYSHKSVSLTLYYL